VTAACRRVDHDDEARVRSSRAGRRAEDHHWTG
jgi:hypothetical protein